MSNDISSAVVRFRVMAAAVLASGPIYAVIGTILVMTGTMKPIISGDLVMILGAAALVLTVAIFAASFQIRRVLAGNSKDGRADLGGKTRALFITLALSETGSVLGLMLAILGQRLDWPIVLWICSFANGLAMFPRRAWIVEGLEE